jgi:peptidyl-prolyl cis-trans isomerase D
MFEYVRTHNKIFFLILMPLVFVSFVFVGVQGYDRMSQGAGAEVARVDGQKITQAEWDAAHRRQVEQMRAQMPGMDAKFFDSPEAKRESLDRMVRDRVLFAASTRGHLSVSDARLMRELQQMPQLAALKRADGSFDVDGYKAMVQASGRSAESFEAGLRQDLAVRQVQSAIDNSASPANAAARTALDALLQQREIQVLRFDSKDQTAGVAPTEAELAAYHKANEGEFRAPEQAQIEVVVLDIDSITSRVSAPEDELRKFYEQNLPRYTVAEERRASHILVAAAKDAPADQRAKAKAKAEQLLAEVRKAPASFAELAKKSSDDTVSAPQGGDLAFNKRDGFAAKEQADAVFAMKAGEISNIVETEFGYHIIRLDAVRGGDKKPFEAVRGEIEAEVKKQLAAKEFAADAERFTNLVNKDTDNFKGVVGELKLKAQTATVLRNPSPAAKGALASPKLLDAVFSAESIKGKQNTEAIEVGPNQLASARIVAHMPARVQALSEVTAQVRERVVQQQAAAKARKAGEDKLAAVKTADSTAGLPPAVMVSRSDPAGQARQVIEAVLKADAAKLPQWLGVDLGSAGYAAVRLSAVKNRAPDAPEVTQLMPRYTQAWAGAESQAYYKALERRFKVKIDATAATGATPAPAAN